jgi:hypothetical protein
MSYRDLFFLHAASERLVPADDIVFDDLYLSLIKDNFLTFLHTFLTGKAEIFRHFPINVIDFILDISIV